VLTQRDAERVAEWLKLRGQAVEAYHSSLAPERANTLEDALLANEVKALVATTKLGMGFDKPDLAFVDSLSVAGFSRGILSTGRPCWTQAARRSWSIAKRQRRDGHHESFH
jgi:hypothetical protein